MKKTAKPIITPCGLESGNKRDAMKIRHFMPLLNPYIKSKINRKKRDSVYIRLKKKEYGKVNRSKKPAPFFVHQCPSKYKTNKGLTKR